MHWPCSECSRSFPVQQALTRHRAAVHGASARLAYAAPTRYVPEATPIIVEMQASCGDDLDGAKLFGKWYDVLYNWAFNDAWTELGKLDRHTHTFLEDFAALSEKLWPMPLNKTISYYRRQREKKKKSVTDSSAKIPELRRVSNHQSKRKIEADQHKQQLRYEQAQWQFNNKRKAIAHSIMEPNKPKCCISPSDLTATYSNVFEKPNNACLNDAQYPSVLPDTQQKLDAAYVNYFDGAAALEVMNSIGHDKSPGIDKVTMRVIRKIDSTGDLHALLAAAMQRLGYYPLPLRHARTILIHKSGDAAQCGNWRPLTIFSMTRRIVSKLFEKELRRYLRFANPQRGFISSPGCLLNISKLASILAHAKKRKSECHAVLLDVKKAFDTVGHEHIEKTLLSIGIPASLRTVCVASINGNSTKIQSVKGFTRNLEMLAGVAQGEPLSPLLFNIAINFIVEKINIQEIREKYGYDDGSGACSVLSFADDTTLIGHNARAVQHLIELTNNAFNDIGLTLNALKTSWLAINAADEHEHLTLVDHLLEPTHKHQLIRYLGAHFSPLQDFNGEEALQEFQTKLERVLQSDLITSHQKLQLLQQYLFPVLNFSFQVTPSKLISEQWLERIDKVVASAMRELLRLRNGTTNEFFYAPRSCRGLAVVHYKQEARLQRLTGLSMLLKEASVEEIRRSILDEAEGCFRGLQIQTESVESKLVQPSLSVVLRKLLRERSFEAWSSQTSAISVHLYKLVPASNRWITKKQPMTHQDWITCMQLTTNTCDLAACRHPAPATQNCRRCTVAGREAHRETLGHVLGYCRQNNGLIINRHDAVVKLLRDELRKIGHTVYYEDRCIGTTIIEISRDGNAGDAAQNAEQSRRVDLVVVDKTGSTAYLIDPTIRIEYDETSVGEALQQKRDTYLPTIPYYRENLNISNIEVHGVWFGSRGAHHPTTIGLFRRLGLIKGKNMTILDTITKLILQHSSAILRNHIV